MNQKILTRLRKEARDVSGSAAFILGRLYDEGWGVRRSEKQALHWYKIAAGWGINDAYYFVASSYLFGHGVRVNARTGFRWLKKAAYARDLTARYVYAQCVWDGCGTKAQPRLGKRLMLQAAREGSYDAMTHLAAEYLKRRKFSIARKWALKGQKAGDDLAPVWLAQIDRERKNAAEKAVRKTRRPNAKNGAAEPRTT